MAKADVARAEARKRRLCKGNLLTTLDCIGEICGGAGGASTADGDGLREWSRTDLSFRQWSEPGAPVHFETLGLVASSKGRFRRQVNPMSERRALVVGATGIAGSNLAHHLVNKGWEVFGLARNPQAGAKIQPLAADLLDKNSVERAL